MQEVPDWSTILAISGGIVGIVGAIVAIINAASSARKSAVNSQGVLIDNLEESYDRLCKENKALRVELDELKRLYDHVLVWAVPRGYRIPKGKSPQKG